MELRFSLTDWPKPSNPLWNKLKPQAFSLKGAPRLWRQSSDLDCNGSARKCHLALESANLYSWSGTSRYL